MSLPDDVVTAFPSLRPPWPGQLIPSADGSPRWGLWDPGTGEVTEADPADDPRLPGLRDWVDRGRLVSYRPGWRAVVRIGEDDGADAAPPEDVRWVHVLRLPRTADVAERHRAMSTTVREIRVPLRVPEVVDVEPAAGVVIQTAVTGAPLRDLLGAPVAEDAIVAVSRALAELSSPEAVATFRRAGSGSPPNASIVRHPVDWSSIAGGAVGDADIAAELAALVPLLSQGAGDELPPVVVHGDLSDRNIFLHAPPRPGGGQLPSERVPQVGTADLEGAGLGDPGRDIASLACHLVMRSLIDEGSGARGSAQAELLLDAYAVAGGVAPVELIRSWQARTYFRLACIHLFRRDTRHLWRELLGRARACASGDDLR